MRSRPGGALGLPGRVGAPLGAVVALPAQRPGREIAPQRPRYIALGVARLTGSAKANRGTASQQSGIPFNAEALLRGVVAKIQGRASVEADRLRDAMRKAIAILTAAIGA